MFKADNVGRFILLLVLFTSSCTTAYPNYLLTTGGIDFSINTTMNESEATNVKTFGAKGDGHTYENIFFEQAIKSFGTEEGTLLIPSGRYLLNSFSFPKNVSLKFTKGAIFVIPAGEKIIVQGYLDAGLYQIIEGDGQIQFGPSSVTEVYPDWWGISYDDSTVDNSVSIQKAINSLSGSNSWSKVIRLGHGRMFVRNTITFFSGIKLVGTIASNAYGGTHIVPLHMLNDTVFKFDDKKSTRWFHHGGLENIYISPFSSDSKPYAAIFIAQMGENAILRNLVIYRCTNGIVLGDRSYATVKKSFDHQVSANLQALSLHENSEAGILINKSTGLITIDMLSGDDNTNILKVDSCSQTLSIVITGIKTEAPHIKGGSPAILLYNSYCSLTIIGGWVVVPKGTTEGCFIEISGVQGIPRICMIGVASLHYPFLISDKVQSVNVNAYSEYAQGKIPSAIIFYNTTVEELGVFPKKGR